MHFLYVDESGVEELTPDTDHFVLLGLSIPAEQWKTYDGQIETVKSKYDISHAEIHTAWMCRRYIEQNKIPNFDNLSYSDRRTKVRKQMEGQAAALGIAKGAQKRVKSYHRYCRAIESYIHLTHDERLNCLEELAVQVGGWNEARVFADALCKTQVPGGESPYEWAFEQIVTRFDKYLENIKGTGIIIQDNNIKMANRLTRLARKFHRQGTLWRNIKNTVETPFFVDSSLTGMIQMADLGAYALRRFVEKKETTLWNNISPIVDRYCGKWVGVRHFTGRKRCSCEICKNH